MAVYVYVELRLGQVHSFVGIQIENRCLLKEDKDMSIKINVLTVTFKNGVTAIDHADLEIPKGLFGLLGENGAGKITLMRVPKKACKELIRIRNLPVDFLEDRTILFSTHVVEDLVANCNQLAVMKKEHFFILALCRN